MRFYVLAQGEKASDENGRVILDVKQQGKLPVPMMFASKDESDVTKHTHTHTQLFVLAIVSRLMFVFDVLSQKYRAAFATEGERQVTAFKALSQNVDDTLGFACDSSMLAHLTRND